MASPKFRLATERALIAVMPLGAIFFALTLPALLLSQGGRRLWLALALGCAGLVAFAVVWSQLLDEFYG